MPQQNNLRQLRQERGLSIQELADLTHLSLNVIWRIEDGNSDQKIHEGVAKAIADVLHVDVNDIFDPLDLTHLGRPPFTGKKYSLNQVAEPPICPNCFTQLPVTLVCDTCGYKPPKPS
jgi:transcriptional regulator with XRE-family HTH domain